MTTMEWRPSKILQIVSINSETPDTADRNYAILLLNQPVQNEKKFMSLWNHATLRALVDGGGNHWDYLDKKFPGDLKSPDIISGDFDSIRSEVLEFFKAAKNVKVILTEDQDETDFTKAIRILSDHISESHPNVKTILAFCETSGRFDQIMAAIETLYHAQEILNGKQIFLMSSSSMTWLLPPGSHKIFICGDTVSTDKDFKIRYCSLIPIGSPCKVTTSGLKWNLQDDTLSFGRLVSTSNEVDKNATIVIVENSHPLLWSMEIEYD